MKRNYNEEKTSIFAKSGTCPRQFWRIKGIINLMIKNLRSVNVHNVS